jgi:hypothetical protein
MNLLRESALASILAASFLTAIVVSPVSAYDYPLTSDAIRDAYFLGTGPKASAPEFYSGYWQNLDMPNERERTSEIFIETPYFHLAEHSRDTANYTAQAAVKDFLGKPMEFRAYIDVYFDPPESGDAKPVIVKLIQKGKEITPRSVDRWPMSRFRDENTGDVSVGERIWLVYGAEQVQDSELAFEIDAPDGEHTEATFDLAVIR